VIEPQEDSAAYLDNVRMQQILLILPIVYHYHKDRRLHRNAVDKTR